MNKAPHLLSHIYKSHQKGPHLAKDLSLYPISVINEKRRKGLTHTYVYHNTFN